MTNHTTDATTLVGAADAAIVRAVSASIIARTESRPALAAYVARTRDIRAEYEVAMSDAWRTYQAAKAAERGAP